MQTLTLEHLAPYLPYGLKCQFTHNGKIDEVTCLNDIRDYDDIKIKIGYSDSEHIWMFKPILRPLRDLYKSIDGIVHANVLYREFDITGMEFNGNINDPKWGYQVYIYLFKHHFDVFNLIGQNLAIDINTL